MNRIKYKYWDCLHTVRGTSAGVKHKKKLNSVVREQKYALCPLQSERDYVGLRV